MGVAAGAGPCQGGRGTHSLTPPRTSYCLPCEVDLALNAYARAVTDRIVAPLARGLVRLGFTANALTVMGLLLTFAGAAIVVAGDARAGALVLATGTAADGLDGAVARVRGTAGPLGAFYDSVADRVGDIVLFGAAAWLVRDEPVLFTVAVVALGGAQLTSYVRAKAESLGWEATVGIFERAERVIILILALFFDLLAVALWLLALGSLVTVVQRLRAVRAQARAPAKETP